MQETACNCGHYPVIILPGIGQSRAEIIDENGVKIRNGWPMELDNKLLIRPIIAPAILMLLSRQDWGFTKSVEKGIRAVLDPLACNPDGTRKHRVRVIQYPYSYEKYNEEEKKFINRMIPTAGLTEVLGESHFYYFAYDIFGEADKTVAQLHEFIQMVKRETGHDKVNFMPVSMGGTICSAYFTDYPEADDVHRVVAVVPAYDGSLITSDLLSGNIRTENYEDLFVYLLGRRDGAKINKYTSYLPRKIMEKFVFTLLESALDTILTNSSTMWGLVPSGAYPSLSKKLLSDPPHAALRAKLDRYFVTRSDIASMVKKQQQRGVSFFNLLGYNYPLVPAIRSLDVSSDGIVPGYSSSMGAYFAPLGQTLGDDYQAGKCNCGNSHISPDRLVDAACGTLPDATWYYRNMEHEQAADNKELLHLSALLLKDDSITSVFSDPDYPQFRDYVHKKG